MADSGSRDSPGKRERLIAAARETVYRQGIEKTTLADIAAAAGIALGNVYYYFKTKDDLIAAVVESHVREARAMLEAVDDAYERPQDRLKALFGAFSAQSDSIARYGCPHGSLCLELDKRADGQDPHDASAANVPSVLAATLMREPLDWAERQFRAMGRPDARDLAIEVIARYQGTALLTAAFRDPGLLAREAERVADWVDTL